MPSANKLLHNRHHAASSACMYYNKQRSSIARTASNVSLQCEWVLLLCFLRAVLHSGGGEAQPQPERDACSGGAVQPSELHPVVLLQTLHVPLQD
jgi:hypothetical protein